MDPTTFATSAFEHFKKLFDDKEEELRRSHSRALADIQQKTLASFDTAIDGAVQQFLSRLASVELQLQGQGKEISVLKDKMEGLSENVGGIKLTIDRLRDELSELVRQEIGHMHGLEGSKDKPLHEIRWPADDELSPAKIKPGGEKYYSASLLYHNNKSEAGNESIVNSSRYLSQVAATGMVVPTLIQDFDDLMKTQRQLAHRVLVAPITMEADSQGNTNTLFSCGQNSKSKLNTKAQNFNRMALEQFLVKYLPDSVYQIEDLPSTDRMFLITFGDKPFQNCPAAWCVKNWSTFRTELGVWVKFDTTRRLRALEAKARDFGKFIIKKSSNQLMPLKPAIVDYHLVLKNLVVSPLLLIPENEQMWEELLPTIEEQFAHARPSWLSVRERTNRIILEKLCRMHELGDVEV